MPDLHYYKLKGTSINCWWDISVGYWLDWSVEFISNIKRRCYLFKGKKKT